MKAKEYINDKAFGTLVDKKDAIEAINIARKEGYQEAVCEIEKAVHGLCNVRQVLETLQAMKR